MLKPEPSRPTSTKAEVVIEEDWSVLAKVVENLGYHTMTYTDHGETFSEVVITLEELEILKAYIPRLLESYAQLWELAAGMMKAWEDLRASKDSLYVPDAEEMVRAHGSR